MNQPRKSSKRTSSKHPFIFKLIILLIPLVILLVFEGVLSLVGYGDKLDLFVQNEARGYEEFMMVNPIIGKKYFQKFEYTSPPNDIFYAEKPGNTFRIFVMGSSTVYGFPYDRNLMFSRILNKQIEDKFPNKRIEVINTAITAINSYTLLDFVDEILKYEPDAILIYAGHNEFYGAFGIGSNETMSRNRTLTKLHISLMNFRLYQLVRNSITKAVGNYAKSSNQIHGTLMKRIVNDVDILLNSDDYKSAMKTYRKNMSVILSKFHKKNIPVFLSDLVSNVKGLEPFNSVLGDSLPSAEIIYNEAKTAEADKDFEKASQLYYYAKDLDCIRFRASEDLNAIVDDLTKMDGVFKVPMLDLFKENSENGLIGNNLMTEHVHPNIDGIFLMAKAFYDKIVESGIIGESDENINYSTNYYKLNWGYSVLDSLIGAHRANYLKGFWPFVKDFQNETNYFQSYQPQNYLDYTVISGLRGSDQFPVTARLQLAYRYEKEGKYDLAYREYESILRENPYVAVNYRDAAKCLMQLDDLPLALKYYSKSLDYEDSFVALYNIGEIYMQKGDFENAIKYFTKSVDFVSDDKKGNVLSRLYAACIYSNVPKEAEKVAVELKMLNDTSLLNVSPKKYIYNQLIPFQTKSQVVAAQKLIDEKKYEDALRILENSLQIYDSHIANRLIAEMELKLEYTNKAQKHFMKVYHEFKFDPSFLHQLVLLNIKKGDINQAREYLQQIKVIDTEFEGIDVFDVNISYAVD